MNKNLDSFINEFKRIKSMGLVKSLRNGPTGIGYTFECLINKEEDQESKPDYGNIEIKCKYGYSKYGFTLFNCSPLRDGELATRYIYEKYGYFVQKDDDNYKIFIRNVYAQYAYKRNDIELKLKVDYYDQRIYMEAYENGVFIEKVCYWEFKTLENRLKGKLNTLAYVTGYPYRRNGETYFKYVKLDIYKLRGFLEFLNMIEHDQIGVQFFIRDGISKLGNPKLRTHGVGFSISKNNIDKLFYKVKSL